MLWSKSFIPTLRQVPQDAESISAQLMLRAGFVRPLVAGVYSYLPMGLKVLKNIESIIRREMDSCGAQELLLPSLQPQELWDATGRNKLMEEIMFRFTDRRKRQMCLGPTHEEVITDLVAGNVNSYKQLPLILYQIQTKFRDEIRPRFGLVRSCEFIMKDAYSFDSSLDGMDKNYKLMYDAYTRIFERCGLSCVVTQADSGVMGGSLSHEFLVLAESGEDTVFVCADCQTAAVHSPVSQSGMALGFRPTNVREFAAMGSIQWGYTSKDGLPAGCKNHNIRQDKAIEIGHIFQLGTKYSKELKALFLNAAGAQEPVIMGCYGIGVSRLIAAIIECNHDESGIIWPREITPYDCIIMALNMSDSCVSDYSFKLYKELSDKGVCVLFDDRPERAGVKFKDADLIGAPLKIIIGTQFKDKSEVELKMRSDGKSSFVKAQDAAAMVCSELKK